ncbi:hypothetical protein M885DRAFT_515552 [Pelagophyceae sp. CCMP2097]|nr:hypothetical protein M885DRAFT_515552 [Pelagophyceae sp. CCMP2097]
MLRLLLALLISPAWALSRGAGVLVIGPGAFEVGLIAAKLAAKAQFKASLVVSGKDARQVEKCRTLMYGREYGAAGVDEKSKAEMVQGPDAIAIALKAAQGIIICCDEKSGPPSAGFISALFTKDNSPKLKTVALLSRPGKGGSAGFLTKSLAESDAAVAAAAKARNVKLAVVRCGTLKGGGPGAISRAKGTAGTSFTDFGLDAFYYSTLGDLSAATALMAHDQFALGASVVNGDPFVLPNVLNAAWTASDFKPRETDANRAVAAGALLGALVREKDAEFSISCEAATAAPTFEEWNKLFDAASRSA